MLFLAAALPVNVRCFSGAARSQAWPFGILPTVSSLQLWRCDPLSSLTSAGAVLPSDAVATGSRDGLCETGGARLGAGGKEFIVYWRFSRRDGTGH